MKTKKQILRILLEAGVSKEQIKTKNFGKLNINIDLSNCNFNDFDFRDSNFSGSNFRNSNFSGSDFSGSNFSGSNFSGSNFSCSNFSGSNFRNSNFSGSNFSWSNFRNSNFSGSDFRNSDFSWSNFRNSNFSGSDFRNSDFSGSNFSCSNFSGSNFRNSNFRNSDFSGSNFRNSNFRNSDFSWSDFSGSNFSGSDFRDIVINHVTIGLTNNCPEEGSFIGYKKANNHIIVIEIQADSKRSGATTFKCRASKIKTIRIENLDSTLSNLTEIQSDYNIHLSEDQKIIYKVNEIIEIPDFDNNRLNECSSGIHFFINRQRAVCY